MPSTIKYRVKFIVFAKNTHLHTRKKQYCLTTFKNGIESVKKNAVEDARYERKEAKNGAPYFNHKATNGQVIGSSEMYSSESARENGIESVKKNAPEAEVVEQLD